MKVTVQTDGLNALKEAVRSDCDRIRWGPEFCALKISSLGVLKTACRLVEDSGKELVYVSPRISGSSIERVKEHLAFLNEKGQNEFVVNDLGVLSVSKEFLNLKPHLGRQLVFIPARSPWGQITPYKVGFLTKKRVAKIFYQISLNNQLTMQFFREHRVEAVDVDWIPACFKYYALLINEGFDLAIYLHFIPVSVTRKCHTARFLGQRTPESCSNPCLKRTFLLKNNNLEMELLVHGNCVFRLSQPAKDEVKRLCKYGDIEFVITMNPITQTDSHEGINKTIEKLQAFQ